MKQQRTSLMRARQRSWLQLACLAVLAAMLVLLGQVALEIRNLNPAYLVQQAREGK